MSPAINSTGPLVIGRNGIDDLRKVQHRGLDVWECDGHCLRRSTAAAHNVRQGRDPLKHAGHLTDHRVHDKAAITHHGRAIEELGKRRVSLAIGPVVLVEHHGQWRLIVVAIIILGSTGKPFGAVGHVRQAEQGELDLC
jgi:hypothetical protein